MRPQPTAGALATRSKARTSAGRTTASTPSTRTRVVSRPPRARSSRRLRPAGQSFAGWRTAESCRKNSPRDAGAESAFVPRTPGIFARTSGWRGRNLQGRTAPAECPHGARGLSARDTRDVRTRHVGCPAASPPGPFRAQRVDRRAAVEASGSRTDDGCPGPPTTRVSTRSHRLTCRNTKNSS